MKSASKYILSVNGGSSSIKFALFEAGGKLRRVLDGRIEGIGSRASVFKVKGSLAAENFSRKVSLPNHIAAAKLLMDWLAGHSHFGDLAAVGHRVVHGGPKLWKPCRITQQVVNVLHELTPFDPEHLPEETLLIESFRKQFPKLPQFACFDTAFHHDLPRVAQLLPIPRRYHKKGFRRYGFHGLSCEYLLTELARLAGARAAGGRVILAHLGSGASVTAVLDGKSRDTSMSFTPAAGLPMSTRSGDLDPALGWALAHVEKLTPHQFYQMVNHESGLLGVSGISSDMRELRMREGKNAHAAEAVSLFCYQTRKWVCNMAAAIEGVDTLVFAGGIGENDPEIRARICGGLEFIGIKLDKTRNAANSPVISRKNSPVTVRMIRTDEESIIAQTVCRILGIHTAKEENYETKKR